MLLKIRRLVLGSTLALGLIASSVATFAQGTFRNLNFESATVPNVPPNLPVLLNASDAVPGWTVYIGTNQSSQVWYNGISAGGAFVSIIDRHTAYVGNRVISFNFTATLDSGIAFFGGTGIPVSAALAETGLIPGFAHSLLFGASGDVSAMRVTFNGQDLPFVMIGTGPNYQMYGADISSIAGQTGELRFTELPITPPTFPIAFLDAIQFSQFSVPEPTTPALLAVGGLMLALWMFRRRQ